MGKNAKKTEPAQNISTRKLLRDKIRAAISEEFEHQLNTNRLLCSAICFQDMCRSRFENELEPWLDMEEVRIGNAAVLDSSFSIASLDKCVLLIEASDYEDDARTTLEYIMTTSLPPVVLIPDFDVQLIDQMFREVLWSSHDDDDVRLQLTTSSNGINDLVSSFLLMMIRPLPPDSPQPCSMISSAITLSDLRSAVIEYCKWMTLRLHKLGIKNIPTDDPFSRRDDNSEPHLVLNRDFNWVDYVKYNRIMASSSSLATRIRRDDILNVEFVKAVNDKLKHGNLIMVPESLILIYTRNEGFDNFGAEKARVVVADFGDIGFIKVSIVGGYSVNCGVAQLVDFLFAFDEGRLPPPPQAMMGPQYSQSGMYPQPPFLQGGGNRNGQQWAPNPGFRF